MLGRRDTSPSRGPVPVILVGLDSLQGLSSARILASRQIPVIAIAQDPRYHSCKTNACDEIIYADTGSDELITTLARLGPQFQDRPVLLPCQDKNVLNISRNRSILDEWYRIILPPHDTIDMMLDKASFYEFARKQDFLIPATFILNNIDDAEAAAATIKFPCVLKPPWRPEAWTKHTKVKAAKAANSEELMGLYRHYHRWSDTLIVQEWVEGPDANHFTCNCYFDSNSKPLVTYTSRKLRQWLPQTGQACLSDEYRNDTVLHETVRLFQSVAFRGLAYLEMKLDERTGQYFIIEPNVGRPTGRASMAEASGVELLYTMYCDALGLALPENRTQQFTALKWMHLLRDTQAALHHWRRGNLSLKDWVQSVRGPKSFALWSWRDPVPFLNAVARVVPVFFSAKEQGKGDYANQRVVSPRKKGASIARNQTSEQGQ